MADKEEQVFQVKKSLKGGSLRNEGAPHRTKAAAIRATKPVQKAWDASQGKLRIVVVDTDTSTTVWEMTLEK